MNQFEMKQRAYQSQLKNRALQVLLYLIDRANKEHTCFPAVATISRELHISISTVKRAMRELVEAGYVEKESRFREGNRGQTSNLYTLIFSETCVEQQGKTGEKIESAVMEGQTVTESEKMNEVVKRDENAKDFFQESDYGNNSVSETGVNVDVTRGGGQDDTALNFQFNQYLNSEKVVFYKKRKLIIFYRKLQYFFHSSSSNIGKVDGKMANLKISMLAGSYNN